MFFPHIGTRIYWRFQGEKHSIGCACPTNRAPRIAPLSNPCRIIAVEADSSQQDQYPELKAHSAQLQNNGAVVIQEEKVLGATTKAEELSKLLH